MFGSNPVGQGRREGVHPACLHYQPLPFSSAAGVVRVKGRPLFTRPIAVWHHLKSLQKYNAERWAQQQQSRVAKQR